MYGYLPRGDKIKKFTASFLGKGKTGIARLAASYPNVLIIPVVCEGTRNFMQPKKHKFPRFWRPVTFHFGKAITWKEWIYHEKGGNLNEEQIYELADQDSEKQKEKLSELYRRFTDQFMITLKNMGAA